MSHPKPHSKEVTALGGNHHLPDLGHDTVLLPSQERVTGKFFTARVAFNKNLEFEGLSPNQHFPNSSREL